MSLDDPSPGGSAWSHCLVTGWVIAWPGPPDGANCLIGRGRRPTARRLARYSSTLAPTPPTGRAVHDWLNTRRPPRAQLRNLAHLWRHWRWWRRNLTSRRLRRGDLRLHALDTVRSPTPAPLRARVNLNDPDAYAWLINTSLHGPIWTSRRLRRRHLKITNAAPTSPAARLLWARRGRGDLTWAPPPPLTGHRHGTFATAALVALLLIISPLIILSGPIGLILAAILAGRLLSPTPTPTNWGPGDPLWRAAYIDPYVLPKHPARAAVRPTPHRQ